MGPRDSNKTGENLVDAFHQLDLILLTPRSIHTYICPRTGKGATLDLVIGNGFYAGCNINTGPHLSSDHLPLIVELGNKPDFSHENKVPRSRIKKEGLEKYVKENKSIQIERNGEIGAKKDSLKTQILDTATKCFKKSNGKPPRKPLNPWWNESCQEAIEEKTRLGMNGVDTLAQKKGDLQQKGS